MSLKPELIVFSQNLMGGGSSFHKNMLANVPDSFFDIKCIYLDPLHWVAKRLEDITINENDIIFPFTNEPKYEIAKRLDAHISNRVGVVVANLPEELYSLEYFPKPNKTVYFICHDKGFLSLTKQFEHLIDVFIAHNIEVYETIKTLLPKRIKDIRFIEHGVNIQDFERSINKQKPLNLVFLARHVKSKGIYDLPKINKLLIDQKVNVNWTILGDGEERLNFINEVKELPNFCFSIPKTNEDVITILKTQDLYILPSSHDGLPVSLLESMSVGCVPVVYNFSEGIKKVITSNIGYVIKLGDFIGITEQIIGLNNNRVLLHDLSLNAVKKIKLDHNIKIQANDYFNLYKRFKTLKKRRNFTYTLYRKVKKNKLFLKFIKLLKFKKK